MKILSCAKVNIFLKITGLRDNYHTILSRFVRVENLYDVMRFEKSDKFDLVGDFGCDLENNTVYKAYELLADLNPKVKNFFANHKVIVEKNIPKFAGLGGGSSNAASFLLLCNDVLNLNLTKKTLHDIGLQIGADVPFFLSGFKSANVSGIGEIVEEFEEKVPELEIFTPKISCSTPKVYNRFRKSYLHDIDIDFAQKLSKMKSKDILNSYDANELNDLLKPSIDLYPELLHDNFFFSGSGSSWFRKIDG